MRTELIQYKSNNISRKTGIFRNVIFSILLFFFITFLLTFFYRFNSYATDYNVEDFELSYSDIEVYTPPQNDIIVNLNYPILSFDGTGEFYIYMPFVNGNRRIWSGDHIKLIANESDIFDVGFYNKEEVSYIKIFNPNSTTGQMPYIHYVDGIAIHCSIDDSVTGSFNLESLYPGSFNLIGYEHTIKTTKFKIPYDYGVKIDISGYDKVAIVNNNQDASNFGYRPLFSQTFNTGIFYKQTETELTNYIIINNLSGTQLDLKVEKRNLIGAPTIVSFFKEFSSSDGRYVYIFYPSLVGALNSNWSNLNSGDIEVYLNYPCPVTLIRNNDYIYGSENEGNLDNNIGTDSNPVIYDPEDNTWKDTGNIDENGNYTEYDTTYRPSSSIFPVNDNLNSFFNNLIAQLKGFFEKPISAVNSLISSGSKFFTELSGLWSWLPSPVVSLITSCLTITLTIGLIKVFL